METRGKPLFHCVSWDVEKQNETRIVLVSNVFCTFAPTYIRMMNKYISTWIIALVLLLTSCSDGEVMDRLDHIKSVGDNDPVTALAMLDSLEVDIRQESEYVKNKYDLLRVRLNDKADNMPSSDIMIKQLVAYFNNEGTTREKQEVNYYAGSVYRDLQDTPRALEYFFKSLDYAFENEGCDSIMLRNTYSNLNYLYYGVQDYPNALDMALKELEICQKTKSDIILPYMHIGASYLALDSMRKAETAFDSAYTRVIRSKEVAKHQNTLVHLLNNYSELKCLTKAKDCLSRIDVNPLEDFSGFSCIAFAQYYESDGKTDSAAIYCKRILDDGTGIDNMYDAAKLLYCIYAKSGDINNASHYAEIYMQLSDSLDFGKRQELAATVNNEYQYHLDQKKELELQEKEKRYKSTLVIISLLAILLVSLAYILYIRKRNKHLHEVVRLSAELQRVSGDEQQLRKDIEQKESELEKSKKSLEKTSEELNDVKQELQRVNAELSNYDEALKAKEQQLSEKMNQNMTFIKLLHQSELEGKAEDVIYAIRQSSTGKKNMKAADWKQLYQAVDELYPTFKDKLLKELGTFTEQQMQVCYLIRIGLSKPQIQNMTNLSRVTVWRWVKKYDWVVDSESVDTSKRDALADA